MAKNELKNHLINLTHMFRLSRWLCQTIFLLGTACCDIIFQWKLAQLFPAGWTGSMGHWPVLSLSCLDAYGNNAFKVRIKVFLKIAKIDTKLSVLYCDNSMVSYFQWVLMFWQYQTIPTHAKFVRYFLILVSIVWYW